MPKTDEQILELLSGSSSLTLAEMAEKLGRKPNVVFKALRKLFEEEKIDCDHKTRRYSLVGR